MSQVKSLRLALTNFNRDVVESNGNNDTSKCVKRLLAALQSASKKLSLSSQAHLEISSDQSYTVDVIKCLAKLEEIVFLENTFAETSVLSGLATAFLLYLYLCDTNKAIHLFFKLFERQSICNDLMDFKLGNNLGDVLDATCNVNDLTKVSLLSALLSCSYFVDYLIKFETRVFTQIHRHIIKVCSHRLIHQFHVFKLIQYWFRAFNTHLDALVQREPNLLSDRTILKDTLDQIDNNWEHPVNGVKDCIRTIYSLLLDTFSAFKAKLVRSRGSDRISLDFDLIAEEVIKTSHLSFSSKAKYRKYSALIQLTGWQRVVDTDPNLCSQMLKYLSINSLSTSIIELYKSIIISMRRSNSEDLLDVWSKYFLVNICDTLKSKNKVIHNNVVAHLLPSTLTIVDNSTQLIFDNIRDSHIAEVALIRIAVDLNLAKSVSPPSSWLISILVNSEDIVREEGLSLLIDERYVTERSKVFELLLSFLMTNLNVDNPSFRQKIISKVERFVTKICISLNDKFALYGSYDESDMKAIEFMKKFCRIMSCNLISGASYQKRITSLSLFDVFLNAVSKHNLSFDKHLDLNEIYFLIFLSIVDKDDKVRKISTNMLINFEKTFANSLELDVNTAVDISVIFLNSPRHQESHCGGLFMRYIFSCFSPFIMNGNEISNRLQLIKYMVISCQQQLETAKTDLLASAKHHPIHGWTLALNNCLSQSFINEFGSDNQLTESVNMSIEVCFGCVELMLSHLSHTNPDSSPSFQEMCESLEAVISGQSTEQIDFDDISMSNDFQLLLSLCWLNIKECSFLLANWVHFCQQLNHQIIATRTLHRIGSQLITILSKCRHKGVIEATCIALTKYTTSLIMSKTSKSELINILSQLLSDSLNCLTKSFNSSITRRSAGIALTIQAILTGESEAFAQGYKLDKSLFSETIDQLIEAANTPLPDSIDLRSDLPQTYALHMLWSIVNTASLSRFTINVVEHLLPICIKGFSCNIWQIRNASLQLFGSCCCRMLGQRKTTDVDLLLTEGSTITYSELFSRYPTLLSVINRQFEQSSAKLKSGYLCPQLVPVLSLLASFSAIGYGEPFHYVNTIEHLVRLLANRIWKIRMLSAKALTSLLPITQLQPLLLHLSSQQDLTCNSIHGLMLSVNYLLILKQQIKDNDYQEIKEQFESLHQKLIDRNSECHTLKDVFQEVYREKALKIQFCDLGIQQSQQIQTPPQKLLNTDLVRFLAHIHSKVEFHQSDDIRLEAAKTLYNSIDEILSTIYIEPFDNVFKLIEIVLIILEDEDRIVRTEAEYIALKITNSFNKTSGDSLNFNVAIDCLLMSCVLNQRISVQRLTDYLLNKLESVISLQQLFESEFQFSDVLFEKEDKNVFAQPLFIMSKLAQCLRLVMSKSVIKIEDIRWKRLVEDCRLCLENKSRLELKPLICMSIWKLPKLFVALNSVFLRTELFMYSIESNFDQKLSELKLCDQSRDPSDNGLKSEDSATISQTYKLLLNKFNFLSFIRQNSLSGYSLINLKAN